jgi:hypothetical protein
MPHVHRTIHSPNVPITVISRPLSQSMHHHGARTSTDGAETLCSEATTDAQPPSNMMYRRPNTPSRVHTPSQEAPTALGQVTHQRGGSLAPRPPYDPRSSTTITINSRPLVRTTHHHAARARPLNLRRSARSQHPRVLPGSVTHRSLLCSMSYVCHNTMYTSQDRGVLARVLVELQS